MFAIDWSSLLFYVAVATAGGLVIYHAVAGFYHLKYYVRRKNDPENWKCQPKRFLKEERYWGAAILGTINMTVGGVLSGIFIYAVDNGLWTRLYFDVGEHGWAYFFATIVGLFVFVDMGAYYVHRAFHFKPLFKLFHRYHHRYVPTTPYAAVAMHPVELVSLQAAAFLAMFIVPLHPAVVGIVLVYILVFNIIDHSGVELESAIPWQAPSRYHDDHHTYFHCNFGQHLMIWDKVHGTLRRKGREYGKEIFGGKGRKVEGTAVDAFEDY